MGEFLKGSSRRSGRYPEMDQPPNSRLFVLCDKNSTEQDLIDHFSPYGTVEYCKIIRDKITNASKGFCYVKFDRASAAANALERANASLVADSQFPIKIDIAEAKGGHTQSTVNAKFSSEPEDTPPRSRLFVVCPKEMSERQLVDCFSQYPDFDYGKVIVDKGTGESKGFAYVKFEKASSAALALESVGCFSTRHICSFLSRATSCRNASLLRSLSGSSGDASAFPCGI